MGLERKITTQFGEDRELYIRLNNVEASNHGVTSHALFRGFLSEQAYQGGAAFMWERAVEFTPDVSKPIWKQAYEALEAELDAEDRAPAPIDGGVEPSEVAPMIAPPENEEDPQAIEARKKRRAALIADAVKGDGGAIESLAKEAKAKASE